ncbi:MAG TPA: glycosyltransferase family 4 protein [Solirubrobacterales bacterium]|nr:glycosyltransferase family 4 protein [Solirubrobacterales bacterium]
MNKQKVLYVVHTHPAIRPGGAEGYALQLYDAMQSFGEFEPIMLARSGPPQTTAYHHRRSPVTLLGDDPNQFLFETDASDYDWLFCTSPNKVPLTRYYRDFLLAHKPDVVHFQHTLHLGLDILRVTRNVLPDAAIFFTLHEYLAICNRDGQMVRTLEDQLCLEQSPRRCHECFPEIPTRDFLLRKRFAQAHFENVDLFISPSQFLRQRYLDWGLPPEKIIWEENGMRLPGEPLPDDGTDRKRNRLAFFGQFNHYKGVTVLLEAMSLLAEEDPDIHLWLHGTSLELQPQDFQDEFNRLLHETKDNVTFAGRYKPESMPRLMADTDYVVMPSRWWENAPRVIQEAFAYGRPVICSGIGGMAEKVTDGVNGLHFSAGDPRSLAAAIRRAAEPGMWDHLRGDFPPLHTMEGHVRNMSRYYTDIIGRRAETEPLPVALEEEPVF